MPKEKTTTRKAAAKGKADGGKKKKGECLSSSSYSLPFLISHQIPTCRSVACLPTCSLPTTRVIRSAMRTLASSSVSRITTRLLRIATDIPQVRSASSSERGGRL